jgi:hypothetical protein
MYFCDAVSNAKQAISWKGTAIFPAAFDTKNCRLEWQWRQTPRQHIYLISIWKSKNCAAFNLVLPHSEWRSIFPLFWDDFTQTDEETYQSFYLFIYLFIYLFCGEGAMPLFLNSPTMDIKSILHSNIAMFSKKPCSLEGLELSWNFLHLPYSPSDVWNTVVINLFSKVTSKNVKKSAKRSH